MAELVDALGSGSSVRKDLGVQIPLRPPLKKNTERQFLGTKRQERSSNNLNLDDNHSYCNSKLAYGSLEL